MKKIFAIILGFIVLVSCYNETAKKNGIVIDDKGFSLEYINDTLFSKVKFINEKPEGVKISYSYPENHTLYSFWKNGVQGYRIFELDSVGKIVEDTTSLKAYINYPVSCVTDSVTTVFTAKICNPYVKLIHAFACNDYLEYDSLPQNSHEWKLNDSIAEAKFKFSKEGSYRVHLRLFAEYKNVNKYFVIVFTCKVLSKQEYIKYNKSPNTYKIDDNVGYEIYKY